MVTVSQYTSTSVDELDADLLELQTLTGPAVFQDAVAEMRERQNVCGIPLHQAARIVLNKYKAGL